MPKSKPQEEQDKPQPRIEVTKSSPKDAEKKAGKDTSKAKEAAGAAAVPEELQPGQDTVLMRHPSAFEQLVEKILKKHKI